MSVTYRWIINAISSANTQQHIRQITDHSLILPVAIFFKDIIQVIMLSQELIIIGSLGCQCSILLILLSTLPNVSTCNSNIRLGFPRLDEDH
jgi:hypothetical protein